MQMTTPDLPEAITRDQVLAALEALGLPSTVRTLELHCTEGLTVSLLGQDADGRMAHVGNGPALITVQIPFA